MQYQILELVEEKTYGGDEAMAKIADMIALSEDEICEAQKVEGKLLHVEGTRFYLQEAWGDGWQCKHSQHGEYCHHAGCAVT